jgi:sensor domain CHASE-containing protein
MPQELLAALVGAAISAVLMVLSNQTNKRQSDIREIFHRLNAIEKDLARLDIPARRKNWRNL